MNSYYDIFQAKLKKCKSKKEYKRLCKEMLTQLSVIDKVDNNMWRIFSTIDGGEEIYSRALATAIKMCILDQQGIPYDILTIEKDWEV